MFRVAIVTLSDKGAAGQRTDESGAVIREIAEQNGYEVVSYTLLPDEREQIAAALRAAADERDAALIVTTGGTGFAPRDITPEATQDVCERMAPGIGEAMRAAALSITPRGMLSRATAGIRGRSLIVNLPGSPKAAKENLEAVLEPLEHGLTMLRGKPMNCAELAPDQMK